MLRLLKVLCELLEIEIQVPKGLCVEKRQVYPIAQEILLELNVKRDPYPSPIVITIFRSVCTFFKYISCCGREKEVKMTVISSFEQIRTIKKNETSRDQRRSLVSVSVSVKIAYYLTFKKRKKNDELKICFRSVRKFNTQII